MKKNLCGKAISLREEGHSYKEISALLQISKSTAYLWVSHIVLSPKAKQIIREKVDHGQMKGCQTNVLRRSLQREIIRKKIRKSFKNVCPSIFVAKIHCALLYWCEGGKGGGSVQFTNSDPSLIRTFVKLFRIAFKVEEQKFRALVHIHEYHDDQKQKEFWSRVCGVPLTQFTKSYCKPHTGKRKKDGYQGCVTINYHSSLVLYELKEVYRQYAECIGGFV